VYLQVTTYQSKLTPSPVFCSRPGAVHMQLVLRHVNGVFKGGRERFHWILHWWYITVCLIATFSDHGM